MRVWSIVVGMALVCLVGCECMESMFEKEKEIPLSDVPQAALTAAEGAVEGITLTEAETVEEDGQTVYILEGEAAGKVYEIEVTADGEVLEVEEETEDDAEDDD